MAILMISKQVYTVVVFSHPFIRGTLAKGSLGVAKSKLGQIDDVVASLMLVATSRDVSAESSKLSTATLISDYWPYDVPCTENYDMRTMK
jgi:hypothetical protein